MDRFRDAAQQGGRLRLERAGYERRRGPASAGSCVLLLFGLLALYESLVRLRSR